MGGIGKTTLENEVYNDASIRFHFDVCAWVTVCQQHNVKEILLSLLRSTKGGAFDMNDEAVLANILQKSLKGKRYLIVLDDMWKSEAWDAVRLCFPSENKGSGILLMTRNTEVARNAGTENLSLQMDLMGPDESLNLFKSIAFANEPLPSEFETIGKQIAEKCHGLPLTIAVIAGLLKSKREIEDSENVATDVKEFVTNDPDKQCSHVLGLSYDHLTSDLKARLLHFGIFREDSEIPVKNLMRSWMAEGFLKLENDLEGEAERCLQELVNRCLVLVCKKSLDGTRIRSCKVHDLIYDLCVREIQKENIFIMNDIVLGVSDLECRYLSMQKMQPFKRVTGDEIDYCLYGLYRAGDEIDYCRYGLYRALLTPAHPSAKAFPATLKKLKLRLTSLRWSYLDIIAELPNLEVLKLMTSACDGEEWHPNVRGFARLKLLLIENNDLKYWKATNDNFPVLERLMIRSCQKLKEIPIEFADIHTLQLIQLRKCPPELGESAARIHKEQEDLGNNLVDVRISDPCCKPNKTYGRRDYRFRIVKKVLESLSKRFEAKIYSLEDSKDLTKLSPSELIHALQAQEQRRSLRLEEATETALQAKFKGKMQMPEEDKIPETSTNSSRNNQGDSCNGVKKRENFPPFKYCRKINHKEDDCWFKGKKPSIQCRYCNKLGHIERFCRVKKKNNQQTQKANVSEVEEQEEFVFTVMVATISNDGNTWFLDIGFTQHMTSKRE
ncbi:hypothetical protein BC332_24520 [Capsicum chinense]|nr:hypothetical protein BC332_24520 [Capsicum chinense]